MLGAVYGDTPSRPAGNIFAPEQHDGAYFSTASFAAGLLQGSAAPYSIGNTIETSRADLHQISSPYGAIRQAVGWH